MESYLVYRQSLEKYIRLRHSLSRTGACRNYTPHIAAYKENTYYHVGDGKYQNGWGEIVSFEEVYATILAPMFDHVLVRQEAYVSTHPGQKGELKAYRWVTKYEPIDYSGAASGGGDPSTANNWLEGAGYLSGGIGAVQIGMLDYRSSLSLSSKIGTFSKFSSTYRLLGTTGKVLGGAATYVGAPLSIGLDYSAMQGGLISGGLFAYRTTGTLSSIAGGALIGAAYGGPWGAAGGTLIGAGFVAGEYIYNGAKYIWNETFRQISNFENALGKGWYPGR